MFILCFFLSIHIYNVTWVLFLKKPQSVACVSRFWVLRIFKKKKKITLKKTLTLTLNLATPFSLMHLVTGCQGFVLPDMACVFIHFPSPFITASCPSLLPPTQGNIGHAACLTSVWATLRLEKTVAPASSWLVLQLNTWEQKTGETEEKVVVMIPGKNMPI